MSTREKINRIDSITYWTSRTPNIAIKISWEFAGEFDVNFLKTYGLFRLKHMILFNLVVQPCVYLLKGSVKGMEGEGDTFCHYYYYYIYILYIIYIYFKRMTINVNLQTINDQTQNVNHDNLWLLTQGMEVWYKGDGIGKPMCHRRLDRNNPCKSRKFTANYQQVCRKFLTEKTEKR